MRDWRKILVTPSTQILHAIKIIDASSLQIVLVVDERNRLRGTVTDGDIRRGILRGISLENPVTQVMNSAPVTANLNDGREKILALMKMKELRQIPVLDEEGVVTGIEFLDLLIQHRKCENWVVLMAGGIGSRLRPLTNECPKPLIQIGNKPILETILENFIEYGFHKYYISVNYRAEMVKDYFKDGSRWGVDIRYIHEDKIMGTAGSLGLLREKVEHPLLIMNGDLLTKVNFRQLLDFHEEHAADATMCVREYSFQIPYGVAQLEKHRLIDIDEKPLKRYFVSAGIYVLEPETVRMIPAESYFDMPNLFKKIIARGMNAITFPIREYWLDIGRIEDLERAKGEYPEFFK